MRIVKRIALGLLLLIVVPIVLAIIGAIVPNPFVQSDDAPHTRRIYVVSNPIHTDIAVPIDAETLAAFPFLAEAGLPITHPNARWLLFGWGARSFYLETPSFADIKPGPTLKALTLDSSVMHVDVLAPLPEADPAVMAIDITDGGYARLLSAISTSFTRADGRVLPIYDYVLGSSDRFFEGEGSFTAVLGCNTWTARMLRSAGLTTGLWTPLPISLTISLGLYNQLPSNNPHTPTPMR